MFSFGEEPLNAGDTASVQCVITKGDSPLDIAFMFQGQVIEPSDDIVISLSGKRAKQLTIESVKAKHAGEYTCIVSNFAGSTTRSAALTVNGTPINVILIFVAVIIIILSLIHLHFPNFPRIPRSKFVVLRRFLTYFW